MIPTTIGNYLYTLGNESKNGSGGFIYNEGTVNIGVARFGGITEYNGGVIYNTNIFTIDDSTAIIYDEDDPGTRFDKTFSENGSGGAIYNIGSNAVFTMKNKFKTASFDLCHAQEEGGAIYNKDGTVNLDKNIRFISNYAKSNGSVIYNEAGTVNIGDNVIFAANGMDSSLTPRGTGTIYNKAGTVNIGANALFRGNASANEGGVIFNAYESMTAGTITVGNNATFESNKAGINGGAIYNEIGTITVGANVVFSSNTANGDGGAICNGGTGIFEVKDNANFKNNEAAGGGAINVVASGKVIIGANAVFEGNNATSSGMGDGGGAILMEDYSAIATVTDGAKFVGNTTASKGGAIHIYHGTLNLIANTNNIEFTSNTAKGVSSAIHNDGTVNLWASQSANIIFNDRITGYSGAKININQPSENLPTTGKVILNEDMSGYEGKVNLYGGTIQLGEKGKWFGGDFSVENSATIDMANGICSEHNFKTVTAKNNLKLVVDADLEKEEMDTISATSFSGSGKITVSKIKIIKDKETDEKITIQFADDKLKGNVKFTGKVETLMYNHKATYSAETGTFTFENGIDINMATAAGAVAASVGGYATQSVIINQAFAGIDRQMTQKVQPKTVAPKATVKPSQKSSLTPTDKKQPAKTNGKQNKKSANINSSNLYVSAGNQIFDDSTTIERSLWLRPFALQETIKLNGVDIDNTLYGTLAGIDLPVGQDKQLSFYLGYAGSKQEFDEVKTNQTGYLVGLTGMLVKEKWYLGVTANGIFNKVSADSEDETNDFDMNMFTIGAKAGYNIDLSDKWILEPNITVMYGIANSDSYQTSLGSIDSQSTSNILVEPQVKAKWQLTNGWQPYGLVGYSANLSNKPKVKADGEELELDSIDGFVEYGIGVNKEFIGSVWSCYGQVTGRSGGRNGFGGNLGIKYKF